jgi:Protein of unknown function (DUF4054)
MSVTPGIVVFDPTAFIAAYPMFATVPQSALTNNFNLATLQLNNTLASIVQDEPTRATLLNLLTAHITALTNGVNGQAPAGVVGRIANASQGSVSVQTEFEAKGYSEGYYLQTPWGAQYWQSMVRYRTARYVRPLYGSGLGADWNSWPQ